MYEYFKKRIRSFKYAFRGVAELIHSTPNAKIHLVMAMLAIILGFSFAISTLEWIAIVIVIGLVIAVEAVNTAIEDITNLISKDYNQKIKRIKDIAAAAVLIVAISALVVGIIIFAPKIMFLVEQI